jgi:hypothetical protein
MNPANNPPNDAAIEIDFSNRRVSFAESENQRNDEHEPQHQANVPLLLQPSYARSKSMIFDELRKFCVSLKWCALDHSTCVGKLISYLLFIFLTFIVPLFTSLFVRVPASSPEDDPFSFNKLVQLPESGLALIAFITLSCFFRRYVPQSTLSLDVHQNIASSRKYMCMCLHFLPTFFNLR